MRDYGKVHSRFWQSRDVHKWSDGAKLAALYLLTSPHANLVGVYYLPCDYAAVDMGRTASDVREAFAELARSGFIAYDEDSGWVWVKKFVAWNAFESPKVAISAARLLHTVPKHLPFHEEALRQIRNDGRWFATDGAEEIDRMIEDRAPDRGDPPPPPLDEDEPRDEAPEKPQGPDDLQDAVELWNAFAGKHGFSLVQMVSPERKSKLRQRLKECGGIEGWKVALGKVEASSFLMGDSDKDFVVTFDFLLQKSRFIKLMEGGYDDHRRPAKSDGKSTDLMAAADRLAGNAIDPGSVF